MAGKSTISITFKLDGDSKSFKDLAKDAQGLKEVITATVSEARQLSSNTINFAALATGIDAAQRSFNQLYAGMKDLTDAYAVQESNERRLETTMRNSMGASDAQIQSIKKLCSAQQELGVIGDEVQLAGAQELATYLGLTSSLETLIPVLNDMNAQQYGLNATCESSVTIATMLGKVMNGQVGALSRYGYTFDEVQEQILKFGTEEERAAVLAEVVSASVGGMNAQLAQTDSGKQQQLANALGDVKEQIGGLVKGAMPFVTIAAQSVTALASITTLAGGVKTLHAGVKSFNLSGKAMSVVTLAMGVSAKKTDAVIRVFSNGLKGGAYSATAFKLALRGLLVASGVGLAIVAVTTIIEKFGSKAKEAAEREKELTEELARNKKEMRNIGELTVQTAQKEIAALDKLYNVAKDETKSKKERTAAISEMQKQYPEYFRNIGAEQINIKNLKGDYDKLRTAIIETARAKAAGAKIEENTGQLIDVEQQIKVKQQEVDRLQAQRDKALRAMNEATARQRTEESNRSWFVQAAMGAEKVTPMTQSGEITRQATAEYQKYNKELERASAELKVLTDQQTELNAANNELAEIIKNTPSFSGNTENTNTDSGAGKNTPKFDNNASTLKAITDNIQILNEKLQNATAEEAVLINQQIALWNTKADAIKKAGLAVVDNTPLWKEDAATLKEINTNIQILNEKLQNATAEEAVLINQQIAAWEAKAEAIKNAGKAVDNTPLWKEDAATLKDIGNNIQILNDQLQTATVDEAALINQQIALWDAKADAIKNAGKEAEKTAVSVGKALTDGWNGIKNIGNSVESITESLQGNGNAWQIVCGIIDGFIGLYQGIQTVVGIIELLTGASAAHAVTKGVEATAETSEAAVRATSATTNAAASAAVITANKLEAASWKELAASEYMAAHAYIPFAGFGIAMGFTTAMLAAVTAAGIPMLADGGVASGPTLAMVGEYAGANSNPEVIAPLDKLRGLLADPGSGLDFSKVRFEIKGRTLVGILAKENNITKRS